MTLIRQPGFAVGCIFGAALAAGGWDTLLDTMVVVGTVMVALGLSFTIVYWWDERSRR